MTTAEAMAVAVLKGDMVAARALADLLQEQYNTGAKEIPPIKHLKVDRSRLRAVFFADPDLGQGVGFDMTALQIAYDNWLAGREPLGLVGVSRVEFYEMPEQPGPPDSLNAEQASNLSAAYASAFTMGQTAMALHEQIAAEREACAKIAESYDDLCRSEWTENAAQMIADEIRARGQS